MHKTASRPRRQRKKRVRWHRDRPRAFPSAGVRGAGGCDAPLPGSARVVCYHAFPLLMNARWQSTTTALAASCLVILAALVLIGAALPPASPPSAPIAARPAAPAPARWAPAGEIRDPDWRPREPLDGAALRLALRRLRVLGSVLYIGAHPDDENTAFLAYLTQG